MSKELTLYGVSRLLKGAGFPQPELAASQQSQVVFITSGHFETLPLPLTERQKVFFHTYQPTIEDIMPKLPSWLSLECDVDRKTGEVTWSMVVRRSSLIQYGDLAYLAPRNIKHPVIACGLAWFYFHSKKADHGKVDTE